MDPVSQDRARQMAYLAPATRKTEIAKTDNGINKVLSDVKQKNCVLIMAILKGVDQDKIGSTILKSLTAESAENKQNK